MKISNEHLRPGGTVSDQVCFLLADVSLLFSNPKYYWASKKPYSNNKLFNQLFEKAK